MTERIYERDSYCREFEAVVKTCTEENGVYSVVLDKTAFFPEGGGQAADTGVINGVKVLDVERKDDIVIHKAEAPLCEGEKVFCEIDWETRFARMQSHAGEHIVSGIVHSLFGYTNVGFHMSDTVMTVDFDGPLTQGDIEKVELLSNRAVYANTTITVSFPTDDELERLDYRSKTEHKDGTRLVTIENVDCCACCAPHPATTGEIGLIKIISFMPYKKGTRIEMLAGINAFCDYCTINSSNKSLMGLLSAPRYGVCDAVNKQHELLQSLKSENRKLSEKVAMSELKTVAVNGSVYAISTGLSYDDLRYCSNLLLEGDIKICVLLSKSDGDNYLYVISSKTEDTRPIVGKLNAEFNGKGGGKPDYAQGRLTASSEDVLKNVTEEILNA